jgi:2,4-dienoyl-CoA reductase-like NADH-dependent reductase (Old Yellow Enzyme family)
MTDYPHLFQSLRLGPVTLGNRVVMSGHHMGLGDGRGGIGARLHAYMVARARGGAAMVGLESSPVHPSSIKGVRPHLFDDDVVPGLRALATDVHAAGSRLSVILWHAGHNMTHLGAGPVWAPSAVPSAQFAELPKAMSLADIDELVAAYAAAARRCRSAGLDAVEVQTSSDYLLGSFLNPVFNRRTDDYGGSLENRMRLIVRVVTVVREAAAGQMAVGVRTSLAHNLPGHPDGYGEADSLAVMKNLVDRNLVDYVSLITGSHFALADLMPTMTAEPAHLRTAASRFRQALGVPVVFAGSMRTPAECEEVLASQDADAVALARPWIADPDWLRKVEAGRESSIAPCISCNQACTFAQRAIGPATCVINPRAGREFARPSRRVPPKKLAVIGGGPAGMEAARRAAERGHRVTLYEASSHLGGDMLLAGKVPYRAPIMAAIQWWERALADLGVSVALGTQVDVASPPSADVVIWAIGGAPAQSAVWRRRPYLATGIPGADRAIHGREVLRGLAKVAGKVLVIDEEGSWPAISVAETLIQRTDVEDVTLVTPGQHPALPELAFTVEAGEVMKRMAAAGIRVVSGSLVTRVEGPTVSLSTGAELGPFDAVVLATGTLPRAIPENALAIGDCVAPRSFWAATDDAMRLVDRL